MDLILEECKRMLDRTTQSISGLRLKYDSNPDYVILEIRKKCYEATIVELERAMEEIREYRATLPLCDVSQAKRLLIALLKKTDLEYLQYQDCHEELADDILKAINCG